MKHVWIPAIHDPVLSEMVTRWKRTDREIGDEMGFDSSTVRIHRMRLGLAKIVRPVLRPTSYGKDPAPPKLKPNPLSVAASCLGGRLVEKPSGFWLDGVPVNLDNIMRETNRVRLLNGLTPVGPPHWHVTPPV